MSSTYSSSLRIELIGSGDQAGAWGATTDSNLAYVLDTAIAGYQSVAISSTAQALTYVNGPSSSAALNQSVYAMLKFTGASAATSIYIPPVSKQYIVYNNSGYAITIYNSTVIGNTTAAGSGITVANGDKIIVWSDGTNVYDIKGNNVTGTVAIANGGTGATTASGARTNLGLVIGTDVAPVASPAFTGSPTAPTPTFGDNDTSIATTAFVQAALAAIYPVGSIYSSTAATNPGTSLGFGTWAAFSAGRVMIGAGGGYSAGATGGSADAVVISHTHTATFTGTALPTHTHTYYDVTGGGSSAGYAANDNDNKGTTATSATSGGTPAGSVTVDSAGVSGTNANLQPYIVVYMWQRTA